MEPLARSLIIAGLVLAGLGIVLYAAPSIPLLGKLPGDIRIARPGLKIYLPITSCLALSAGVSLVLWLISRFR